MIPPGTTHSKSIKRGRFLVTPTTPEQLKQIQQAQQTVPPQSNQPTPPIVTQEGIRRGRFLVTPLSKPEATEPTS